MAKKRVEAQNFILTYIDKILPGSGNKKIYEDLFGAMTDEMFDDFIQRIKRKEINLALIAPIMSEHKLDTGRNLEIGKELGHEFFERIWMDGKGNSPMYLSTLKYLVVDLPLRRQAQLSRKKISIPGDNRSVDYLTGQPTGNSKGSKISYPELQILAAQQLDNISIELIKFRGGDQKGFAAMNDSIAKTGRASMRALGYLNSRVKSTNTLQTYLTCLHLKSTI